MEYLELYRQFKTKHVYFNLTMVDIHFKYESVKIGWFLLRAYLPIYLYTMCFTESSQNNARLAAGMSKAVKNLNIFEHPR